MTINATPATIAVWDKELQDVEATLKRLRDEMQMADADGTGPTRSLLSGAKLQVGQARGSMGHSVSEASQARALDIIKGSPPCAPSGTRVIGRGRRRRAAQDDD